MRVTNGMIRNNTINNLYKNISSLNRTYSQMSTGKKIQTVSDDPIIAGRSLKLKVNVLETEQYQKNAKEARSWMEVTETSLKNMKSILTSVRTKCVQASTGTLSEKDKGILKTDIEQLWKQMQDEANVTYGGRYVYTGYKTGEPLMLIKDTKLEEDCTLSSDMITSNSVKLEKDTELKVGTVLAAGTKLSGDDARALGLTADATLTEYELTQDIKLTNSAPPATGEVSIPGTSYILQGSAEMKSGSVIKAGTKVKEGTSFGAGNLNPLVYGKIDGQEMKYTVGIANTITVNTLGMDNTFNDLIKMMNEIVSTVNDSLEKDTDVSIDDLHKLFNDKLGEIDEILEDISTKTADLGSRMSRLDYVDKRLTDNKADYRELLSNTEDIDVEEVYVQFNSQYAAYTAALQATSKVIMNTLADYL